MIFQLLIGLLSSVQADQSNFLGNLPKFNSLFKYGNPNILRNVIEARAQCPMTYITETATLPTSTVVETAMSIVTIYTTDLETSTETIYSTSTVDVAVNTTYTSYVSLTVSSTTSTTYNTCTDTLTTCASVTTVTIFVTTQPFETSIKTSTTTSTATTIEYTTTADLEFTTSTLVIHNSITTTQTEVEYHTVSIGTCSFTTVTTDETSRTISSDDSPYKMADIYKETLSTLLTGQVSELKQIQLSHLEGFNQIANHYDVTISMVSEEGMKNFFDEQQAQLLRYQMTQMKALRPTPKIQAIQLEEFQNLQKEQIELIKANYDAVVKSNKFRLLSTEQRTIYLQGIKTFHLNSFKEFQDEQMIEFQRFLRLQRNL